jgi:UDP-N-acetyl-2-amino-2-deoxyglucuronate dehydrogenase
LNGPAGKKYKVDLEYITARGNWYHSSWKGDIYKSGGITTNIGIHFFDVLLWIFGDVKENIVHQHGADTASGKLELEKAEVNWMLSINGDTLPDEIKRTGSHTYRSLVIDEQAVEFSDGFGELHTRSYKEILGGNGITLAETKNVIQLLHDIRS